MQNISRSIDFKQAKDILYEHGFRISRQNGSHVVFKHPDGRSMLVDVKLGTSRLEGRSVRNFICQLRRVLENRSPFIFEQRHKRVGDTHEDQS